MGLNGVLNIANSGLGVAQSSLEIVSRNIANTDTPGYTRKNLAQENIVTPDGGLGVRATEVSRQVNAYLQDQARIQGSGLAELDVRKQFLDRVDQIFGRPGEANGLDTIVNNFSQSLQELVAQPDSFASRETVLGDAQILAQHLRSLSDEIQSLRQLAEDTLASDIDDLNDALSQVVTINQQIYAASGNGPPADLLDQRDKFVDRVSEYLQVDVSYDQFGGVALRTAGGETLLEGTAVFLEFNQQGSVNANTVYDPDPDIRGVGTITLRASNGYTNDLIASGAIRTGRLGGLVDLRDNILVEAQAQLDELAHGLALAFSQKSVDGVAVAPGPEAGFDIDLAGLLPGDQVQIQYTEIASGEQKSITLVRVDDSTQLPLSDDATPDPNDTVVGISFANGVGAAIADINAALGPLTIVGGGGGITASNPTGSTLRLLDDGALGTINIDGAGATVTSTASQDDGLQLALFVDGSGNEAYSNHFEGTPQKIGFASRLRVNEDVLNNNELLVRHSTSPLTPIGDPDRPAELIARLSERGFTFSPESGIGSTGGPYTGSVTSFAQRIVGFQTQQSDSVNRAHAAQEVVTNSLRDRFNDSVSVDVDQELANMVSLQNSFAANARVMQTVRELMDILLNL